MFGFFSLSSEAIVLNKPLSSGKRSGSVQGGSFVTDGPEIQSYWLFDKFPDEKLEGYLRNNSWEF